MTREDVGLLICVILIILIGLILVSMFLAAPQTNVALLL